MPNTVSGLLALLLAFVSGQKHRESQILYGKGRDSHYILIPDPRSWPQGVIKHLNDLDLIHSRTVVNGVKVFHMNPYIIDAKNNTEPATKASVIRVNSDGLTEMLSSDVDKKGRECFTDVIGSTPAVAVTAYGHGVLHMRPSTDISRVEHDLSSCDDGFKVLIPRGGDQFPIIGTYVGVNKDNFALRLKLTRDHAPEFALRQCVDGQLGELQRIIYHQMCNFLLASVVFKKGGTSQFFHAVLTPITSPLGAEFTNPPSCFGFIKRSKNIEPFPASPNCHGHYYSDFYGFTKSNIKMWDGTVGIGYTVRQRGVPRRFGLFDRQDTI
ncbi:hypothetical protein FOL47_001323 [Perkinsus chesapeaki]|uniref:Uncharacterized protein n=1 Tax=Perkinsus chesapeaki TaxID=330153 RepID=A0A7J6MJU5_PERCH|nr:hypothetical protein FOL47_001323 [Perkinsus chesapeaki]